LRLSNCASVGVKNFNNYQDARNIRENYPMNSLHRSDWCKNVSVWWYLVVTVIDIQSVRSQMCIYRGADKSLTRPDWKKQLKDRHYSSDGEVIAAADTSL